ncbi:MAG: hypothetical protein V4686_01720 [Patescibacteria group bacterium]
MEKPEQPKTLARLANLPIDNTAFRQYVEYKKGEGDVDIFREVQEPGLTHESFAIAGHIIEKEWEGIMGMNEEEMLGEKIPLDEEFWINFEKKYIELARVHQQAMWDKAYETSAKMMAGGELDREEQILMRFTFLNMNRNAGKGLGFPSFTDLVLLYGRFAEVAPKVFKNVTGLEPSEEEYEHMLQDSSFQTLMTQLMNNNQAPSISIAYKLLEFPEGVKEDFEDPVAKMIPEEFIIEYNETGPMLKISPGFIKEAHEYTAASPKAKDPSLVIRRCPVLYTGKFKEMCAWMHDLVKYHYIDQKYKE